MEHFPTGSFFEKYLISSHDPLRSVQNSRMLCSQCNKSSKYFCYRCVKMTEAIEGKIPVVPLPINMQILKHEQELDSKSTAIHAKLLAPTQISIHNFLRTTETSSDLVTDIISDPAAFVILFPDASAVELKDLPAEEFKQIRNVIVIDGTWTQAAAINRTEPYCRLRRIKIAPNYHTVFWRYQDLGSHCLSTIEAIYYFIREFSTTPSSSASDNYDGKYDNLLYFFSFFYHLIQNSYIQNPNRLYTSRHRKDYIKRD